MLCPNCNTEISDDAKFCQECGSNLQKEIIDKEATENKPKPKLSIEKINSLQSQLSSFSSKAKQIDSELGEVDYKMSSLGFEGLFKRMALIPKYYSQLNSTKNSFAKLVLDSGQRSCSETINFIKPYVNIEEYDKLLSSIKYEANQLQGVTYRASFGESDYSDAFDAGYNKISNCADDINKLTESLSKELNEFK